MATAYYCKEVYIIGIEAQFSKLADHVFSRILCAANCIGMTVFFIFKNIACTEHIHIIIRRIDGHARKSDNARLLPGSCFAKIVTYIHPMYRILSTSHKFQYAGIFFSPEMEKGRSDRRGKEDSSFLRYWKRQQWFCSDIDRSGRSFFWTLKSYSSNAISLKEYKEEWTMRTEGPN